MAEVTLQKESDYEYVDPSDETPTKYKLQRRFVLFELHDASLTYNFSNREDFETEQRKQLDTYSISATGIAKNREFQVITKDHRILDERYSEIDVIVRASGDDSEKNILFYYTDLPGNDITLELLAPLATLEKAIKIVTMGGGGKVAVGVKIEFFQEEIEAAFAEPEHYQRYYIREETSGPEKVVLESLGVSNLITAKRSDEDHNLIDPEAQEKQEEEESRQYELEEWRQGINQLLSDQTAFIRQMSNEVLALRGTVIVGLTVIVIILLAGHFF